MKPHSAVQKPAETQQRAPRRAPAPPSRGASGRGRQYRGHETGGHVGLAEHQRHQGEDAATRAAPAARAWPPLAGARPALLPLSGAFIGIVIQPSARGAIELRLSGGAVLKMVRPMRRRRLRARVRSPVRPAALRAALPSELRRHSFSAMSYCLGPCVLGTPLAIQDSVGIVRPLLPPRAIIHPARCNSRFPTAAPACRPCSPLELGTQPHRLGVVATTHADDHAGPRYCRCAAPSCR